MTIRLTWKRLVLGLVAVVLFGMGFAWSGLFPIAASSGHWAITDWFLHWTMQNSARTYSTFQTPKEVHDNGALVSAAGHFRQSCAVCHGAPGTPPSPVMQAATPPAPDLAKTVDDYSDRELFWIVRHGVKYTGMPAWPAGERPDEVRRMVGFLRRLPGMSAEDYRALTAAPPGPLARCTGCHGGDGKGRGQTDIPILAGQKEQFLLSALRDFASGKRQGAVMQGAASGMTETEMRAAARYFANLPGLRSGSFAAPHPTADRGLPGKQLPSCLSCHAPGKAAPVLSGQRPEYLAARLRQWRGEEAVIDARKPRDPMAVIARRIPEAEIDGLAEALSR
ncbi:MAG: c-type cytochrome [Novosphingobium sp.]|nr:c-type cytochrome [Novosphingobium sp.]